MTNRIFKRWIKDLRSGNFIQGQGYLCQEQEDQCGTKVPKRHCCLGVLADQGVDSGDIQRRGTATGSYEYKHKNDSDDEWVTGLPTPRMMEWAGIPWRITNPEEFGSSETFNTADRLAGMNDTQNWNFKQIADWVETTLTPLVQSSPSVSPASPERIDD